MRAVLLDTHVWAWSLLADDRLSPKALAELNEPQTILVSAISFFEIAQKVRIGNWPEMQPMLGRLPALLEEQRGVALSLDPVVCLAAGKMSWAHRDPFDRLLAATAIHNRLPIVSADAVFDGLVTRLW